MTKGEKVKSKSMQYQLKIQKIFILQKLRGLDLGILFSAEEFLHHPKHRHILFLAD